MVAGAGVGAGAGVPGVGAGAGAGAGAAATESMLESCVLVADPTNPVPALNPIGVNTKLAYFSWNFTTALLVKLPKYIVSLPAEPTPEAETCVSADWFNNA